MHKKILHILLVFCVHFSVYAQPDTVQYSEEENIDDPPVIFSVYAPIDTIRYTKDVTVDVRIPSEKKMDKYLHDKNFQYEEEVLVGPTWLERFWWWLLEKIFGKLEYSDVQNITSNFWDYIIIPLAILIIIIVILKFLGVNFSGIFGRKTKPLDIEYKVGDEDVRSSEFDALLENALNNKNYRLAVRYLYLRTLQKLNDKQLIKWNPNKTNHSYIEELSSDTSLQNSFKDKVYLFELIWYGEYAIHEKEFEQIRNSFSNFDNNLNSIET